MKRVVIIGAGGHGREVSELMRHQTGAGDTVLGFVDDDPQTHNRTLCGLPVLGDWSWFEHADRSELFVICAIGLPHVREQLVRRAVADGLRFTNAISPLAYVSPDASIGKGVMIFPNTFVSAGSVVADHAIVNVCASVSHNTHVSRYGTLNPAVHLAGHVTIGEGSYLGIGSSVITGVSIGEWSTIGAGAVVIRDLPDNVTAVGVPAEIIRTREKE